MVTPLEGHGEPAVGLKRTNLSARGVFLGLLFPGLSQAYLSHLL